MCNGDLLKYDTTSQTIDSVGSVASGIQWMSFSPDQDLVVLVTGHGTLILMARTFDAICEQDLNPKEYGANEAITVGWGSKETQFHGSEGKQAAKVTSKACESLRLFYDS